MINIIIFILLSWLIIESIGLYMRIILLTFLLPLFTNAMQLSPEQKKAEDNCLEARLKQMLPPDQVIYFLNNMPRLLNGRDGFHNPLNVYLANDYTVALHYNPDLVKVYRTTNEKVSSDALYRKASSGNDQVEVTPAKFVEILRKINNRSKTID